MRGTGGVAKVLDPVGIEAHDRGVRPGTDIERQRRRGGEGGEHGGRSGGCGWTREGCRHVVRRRERLRRRDWGRMRFEVCAMPANRRRGEV